MLLEKNNKLYYQYDGETVEIQAWGKDSFRVRASMKPKIPEKDWALLPQESFPCKIHITEELGIITNGRTRPTQFTSIRSIYGIYIGLWIIME